MSEWQPIETAPKDGTCVLLWGGKLFWYGAQDEVSNGIWTKARPVTGWWEPEAGIIGEQEPCWRFASYDGGVYGMYTNPTHWMPLPAPPKA